MIGGDASVVIVAVVTCVGESGGQDDNDGDAGGEG